MTIAAMGKNREQAQGTALNRHDYAYGRDYDIAITTDAELIQRIPPRRPEWREVQRGHWLVEMVNCQDAPSDQWLELWKFQIDFRRMQ